MKYALAIILALSMTGCGTIKTLYDLNRCGGAGNCGSY